MHTHKKTLLMAMLGCGLLCALGVHEGLQGILGIQTAWAAAPDDMFDANTQATIANIFGQIITYLSFGTWAAFVLVTQLLDPRVIFDLNNGGALVTMLNQIWQLSRDLMNVIFAFMLVGAALYTVIKAKKDFIAEHAGKFIMAVILVNFSWFMPRVVIDVANIATATIYGIPSLLATTCNQVIAGTKAPLVGVNVPPQNVINPAACVLIQPVVDPSAPLYKCPCEAITNAKFFVTPQDVTNAKGARGPTFVWNTDAQPLIIFRKDILNPATMSTTNVILNGLIVNQARMQSLATIPAPIAGNQASKLIVFLLRELVTLVIFIALFFPLLAMALAFLIRIPILWITIAFMPFYFLTYLPFMDSILKNFSPKEKILDNFLTAAFMPAMVAVPLTIGFVMINAAILIPGGPLDQIQFPLLTGIQSFYQLIWLCMALAIMWVGVFTAFESNKYMAAVTQKVRQVGADAGRLAVKIPMAAPIPLPGGKGMTPLDAMKVFNPRNLNAAISQQGGLRNLPGYFGSGGASVDDKIVAAVGKADARSIEALEKAVKKMQKDDKYEKKDIEEVMVTVKSMPGAEGINASNIANILEKLQKNRIIKGQGNLGIDAKTKINTNIAAPTPPAAPPTPPA